MQKVLHRRRKLCIAEMSVGMSIDEIASENEVMTMVVVVEGKVQAFHIIIVVACMYTHIVECHGTLQLFQRMLVETEFCRALEVGVEMTCITVIADSNCCL